MSKENYFPCSHSMLVSLSLFLILSPLSLYICVCACVCVGLVWFLCLMAYQLFLGYLMRKPFSYKKCSGTIKPIAGRIRGFIPFPRVFARKWSTNSCTTIPQSIALTITPRGHPRTRVCVRACVRVCVFISIYFDQNLSSFLFFSLSLSLYLSIYLSEFVHIYLFI